MCKGGIMTINEKRAKIFKAFCDANRLIILSHLQMGEKCACELLEVMPIEQSTLSHHMKILCEAEIVDSRKLGKMTLYALSEEGVERAKEILEEITEIKAMIPSKFAI